MMNGHGGCRSQELLATCRSGSGVDLLWVVLVLLLQDVGQSAEETWTLSAGRVIIGPNVFWMCGRHSRLVGLWQRIYDDLS